MIKYEFKTNFKSLLLWTISVSFLYIVVFIIYPSLMSESNASLMRDMLATMPQEMLKMFNMDILSLEKVSGWFYTEGFVLLVIIGSIYASILGSTILTKEEDEKTIEYLYSKPISKNKIITNKILVCFFNIFVFNLIIMIVNIVGLYFSNDLELVKFMTISFYQILSFFPIFAISLFISTYFKRTKKTLMMGLAFAIVQYFIKIISDLSSKVEFIKYFSVFSLSSFREYITTNTFSYGSIVISCLITILFLGLTYYNYNRKEFA